MLKSPLSSDRFRLALEDDTHQPVFLSTADLRGGWRDILPELAKSLPEPYPVFDPSEERVLAWGYPVVIGERLKRLDAQLKTLIEREIHVRLVGESGEQRRVAAAREKWLHSIGQVLENAQLNDYGRGFVEIALLFLTAQIHSRLQAVPKAARILSGPSTDGKKLKIQIASRLAALIVRASSMVSDRLRNLSDSAARRESSPLLGLLCRDPILLVETYPPPKTARIAELMPGRLEGKLHELLILAEKATPGLRKDLGERKDLLSILKQACNDDMELSSPFALLQPCLLKMLSASGLLSSLGISRRERLQLEKLSLHLKALELIAKLRRAILPVVEDGKGGWQLQRNRKRLAIAASTRPLDFMKQGVIGSTVSRFGLIYDLRGFSEVLEDIRRKGKKAEESSLQFMYIFQEKVEEIAQRRRLRFEKFLGDGAFLTSRRAARALAAAAEIQQSYVYLKERGFPFSQGMRVALNAGEYHLLPMRAFSSGRPEYEFFGHKIVELARLTTGKSTREIEEVAQMLVGRGYSPERVESFLRPLMEGRNREGTSPARPLAAYLDQHGELINEGIVLTIDFVEELEKELGKIELYEGSFDNIRWLVLQPDSLVSLRVGFRILGTARLKGLPPTELVEAIIWGKEPTRKLEEEGLLLDLLRRRGQPRDQEKKNITGSIPDHLVIGSYHDERDQQRWILGQYRESDDILLHALQVPIEIPNEDLGQPLEFWIFENRGELAKMYQMLLRESSGRAIPMSKIRSLKECTACFLASPHKSP